MYHEVFECEPFPSYNLSMKDHRNIKVGFTEDIGYRTSMEDSHAVYQNPEKGFFSAEVYDGHGGKKAALAATEMITPHFLHTWARESEKLPGERKYEHDLLRESYLAVDKYLVESKIDSGTTASGLYLIDDRFLAANCGDARIIIGTENDVATLTLDHKPDSPDELERIEANGGFVIPLGVARVQGVLAVSRSIGDRSLKPFVIAEPRIAEGYLGRENDFAVIACDGIWDVLSADIVIDIVRAADDAQTGAENIKTTAMESGCTDNVTVVVLDLRKYTASLTRAKMEIVDIIDKAIENRQ
jgi:serine/threonine protein phosphatase PrpC